MCTQFPPVTFTLDFLLQTFSIELVKICSLLQRIDSKKEKWHPMGLLQPKIRQQPVARSLRQSWRWPRARVLVISSLCGWLGGLSATTMFCFAWWRAVSATATYTSLVATLKA
jgi:hypothetical protein